MDGGKSDKLPADHFPYYLTIALKAHNHLLECSFWCLLRKKSYDHGLHRGIMQEWG